MGVVRSHVAFRGFLPRKTTPRDLHQATVIAKPLNVDIRLSGEARMTPNRQSPAYALFARRPIVPRAPDVRAADPNASQEPLRPSGSEATPVTECPLCAPVAAAAAPIVKQPRQKAAAADSQSAPIAQSSLQSDPSAAARRLSNVQNRPVERLGLSRLRIKIKKQSKRCTGGAARKF
jgi:hypothetical protein